MKTPLRWIAPLAILCLSACGCAVRWTDPDRGTTRLLGFGHLAVVTDSDEAPPQAVLVTSSTLGLDVAREPDGLGLGLGRVSRLQIAPDGAAFRIAAPRTPGLDFHVSEWIPEEESALDDAPTARKPPGHRSRSTPTP